MSEASSPPGDIPRDKLGRKRPTGRPKGAKQAEKRLTIKKVNKILGMHLKGASNKEIIEITDSSPNSVTAILKMFEGAIKHIKDIGPYRTARNDILDATELLALKSLNDTDKVAAASWRDLAVGFEKIAKINRLYHGQSTQNVEAAVGFFDKDKQRDDS